MILFGHPTGNPNSHHAALAHFERGRLESFVVPWFPSSGILWGLDRIPSLRSMAGRIRRRRFEPLASAAKIQGRPGEFKRLAMRACGMGDEGLSYEANDWLMRTMSGACTRTSVTAVHSFEDCSLQQFETAKRLDKACLYDMPIGYYPAWEGTQAKLVKRYADWLPVGGLPSSAWVRPEQKRKEMELADLVLAPSEFVRRTVLEFQEKKVALARYGVLSEEFLDGDKGGESKEVTFLFAGQLSVRKGAALLLQAWRQAELPDANLILAGSWQLAEAKRRELPAGTEFLGPVSRTRLKEIYRVADVLVLPTYFEGRALVVGEAMAAGCAILTTDAAGYDDLLDDSCSRIVGIGSLDELIVTLRFFSESRDQLLEMKRAARRRAESCTWQAYRQAVSDAVAPFV